MVRLWLWTEGLNESWNALHALHAFSTALYPPGDEPRVNNYPPLWFYLTGALARIFGDPVFPGRIVSLLAFAAIATAIFAIVYRLGSTVISDAVAGLSFVAFMAVAFRWWIGAAEPQMLALAFVTSGAVILVGARTRTMVALAALLMIIGGLTKHIVVALPLASAVWLAMHRRPLFIHGFW